MHIDNRIIPIFIPSPLIDGICSCTRTHIHHSLRVTRVQETDRSVADLLSTDVRSDVDFSLDVVFTTLPIELEQMCRSAVILALSKVGVILWHKLCVCVRVLCCVLCCAAVDMLASRL